MGIRGFTMYLGTSPSKTPRIWRSTGDASNEIQKGEGALAKASVKSISVSPPVCRQIGERVWYVSAILIVKVGFATEACGPLL